MNDIWNIVRDIVLPHIGSIIINIIGFSFLGLIIAILLLVFMFRKKIMTRSHTAYHIIVRVIYIPFIVLVCMYSFGNLGFIRGVYQVVSAENQTLVNGIYNVSAKQLIGTDEQKDAFIQALKASLIETEDSGLSLADSFERKITKKTESGPGVTRAIVSLYRKEIYKAVLNGVFYAVDAGLNTETDHESLEKAMDVLYSLDRARIENAVKSALGQKVQELTDSHYHAALVSNLIFWILLMSIPFLEFLIYRQVTRKQVETTENTGQKTDTVAGN